MSGRYEILGHLARGGMASVYLGRMSGSAGFNRLVAIKRLRPELAAEREFVAMLVDEARVAAQIRHTNVIDTLDFVVSDGAFSLVLEYVDGDSLSVLVKHAKKSGESIPRPIALAIMHGVLRGLDAAHEARGEDGHPLGVVHRDVSPQNILVGVDGVPRLIDFGVAKATGRLETTRPGEVRGKLAYMAPEQLMSKPVTRQVDVYAAGIVLWELLTGRRPFKGDDDRAIVASVLRGEIAKPSEMSPDVPRELDEIVLRATSHDPGRRHLSARELLAELEPFERASDDEVGAWVRRLTVERRAQRQRILEGAPSTPDLRSLDEVMDDLAQAPPPPSSSPSLPSLPSPTSASAMEVAARPSARTHLNPTIAVAIALGALVVVAVGIGSRSTHEPAEHAVTPAPPPPQPPPPAITVTSTFVDERPAPSASSAAAPARAPSTAKPPLRKGAPHHAPSPDPASFR